MHRFVWFFLRCYYWESVLFSSFHLKERVRFIVMSRLEAEHEAASSLAPETKGGRENKKQNGFSIMMSPAQSKL